MDSSQSSSFIPKTPMSGTLNKRRVRKMYIFTYLIYIFFISSLLAAGGTWFYKVSTQNKLAAVQSELNEERKKFNQADLEKVTELDSLIIEANKILTGQVSVVQILEAVERVTLVAVDMRGFLFEKDINTKLVLELSAEASDFNTTLFQRQVLSGDAVLGGATVTGVTYANTAASEDSKAKSSVLFTVEKDILPGTILPQVQTVTLPPTVSSGPEEQTTSSAAATESVQPLVNDNVELLTP